MVLEKDYTQDSGQQIVRMKGTAVLHLDHDYHHYEDFHTTSGT